MITVTIMAIATRTPPLGSAGRSPSASRSTPASSWPKLRAASLPIRSRCCPTPATISATFSRWRSLGWPPCWLERAPTARFTYGLRSSSILAALFNATLLLVAVGALSWEALRRFGDPQPVAGGIVMAIAGAGVVVNGVTAALFASGRGDLNLRGAYLHMAADAVVSVGVMAAGLAVMLTGWPWLDPLVSLGVNAVIIWGTWGLLSESFEMAMAAAPRHIEPAEVRAFLAARPASPRSTTCTSGR